MLLLQAYQIQPDTFLYHISNQLIIDEYRKRKTSSLDVLLEKGFTSSVDTSERMVNFYDGKAALLLIQHLPPKYKTVTHMRYVQGLTLKEIALITGQSRKTRCAGVSRSCDAPQNV